MPSLIQEFKLIGECFTPCKSFAGKTLDNFSTPTCYLLGRKVISLANRDSPIVDKPIFLTKVIVFSFCVVIFAIGVFSFCALAVKSLMNWKGRIKTFQTNTDAIFAELSRNQPQEKYIIELLNAGANVNALNEFGASLLGFAASKGLLKVTTLLLDLGADVNLASTKGDTPLMLASDTGQENIVKLLLKKNVSIDHQNIDGLSAFRLAIKKGHFEVAKILLTHGAQLNLADKDGNTALHDAAHLGESNTVKFLLDQGADVNLVNNYAYPPFLWAYGGGYTDLGDKLYQLSSPDCQAWFHLKAINQHFGLSIEIREGNRTTHLTGGTGVLSYSSLLNSIQNSQNWLKEAPSIWTLEDTEKVIRAIKRVIQLSTVSLSKKIDEILTAHQNHEIVIVSTGYDIHARSVVFFETMVAKADRGHKNPEERNIQILQIKHQKMLRKAIMSLLYDTNKEYREVLYFDGPIHTDLQLQKYATIHKSAQSGDTCAWCAPKTSCHSMLYFILHQKFLTQHPQNPDLARSEAERYSTNMYKALIQDARLITIKNCIENVLDSNPYKHYVLACAYHHRKCKSLEFDPIMQLIETRAAKAVELLSQCFESASKTFRYCLNFVR